MAQRAVRVADEPQLIADEIDIIKEVEDNPVIALTDQAKFDAYYAAIEAQARAVPVDLSTPTGRDKIKSAAALIARKKTQIDTAGKNATEEWRKLTGMVNAARNAVKERLDKLRDDIRRPVTEWDNAEEARRAEADLIIENLRNAAIVRAEEVSDDIQARLDRVRGHNLNSELFGPRIELVTDLRDETVQTLQDALARLKQVEADRAELARLREQAAAAEQAEVQRKAAEEARIAEEKRKADDAARIEREREEAAQRAKDEAERAHKAEQDRIAREKQAEVDAANERAEQAERARQQEAYARSIIQHIHQCALGMIGGKTYPYLILLRELDEKIVIDSSFGALEDEARQALSQARQTIVEGMERQQKRAAEEAEKQRRQVDQAHRSQVMGEAKQAIMACGVDEPIAKLIVVAIAAKNVPHISIAF